MQSTKKIRGIFID